jgi:amino acid transporter
LKYGILNDAIWFVYLYAMFMAMLQFTQASVSTTWDTINIVAAAIVFVFLLIYTGLMIYLGNKYKDPTKKHPTRWAFLKYEPNQFPM